ncbi:MAG: NAD-dependent deacylase [Atopobium sp.]|nr:NAD-dependent deacylase [Atopobium sp.]
MTKIEQLKDWIQSSDNIVFFGGAGVSTESGIPDFRGTNGLYRQGGIKVENMTIGLGQDGYDMGKEAYDLGNGVTVDPDNEESFAYSKAPDFTLEEIFSLDVFFDYPAAYYTYFRNSHHLGEAQPNIAHKWLADLEAAGKLRAVVTQNIDGLHQAAGSKRVFELHGNETRFYCPEWLNAISQAEVLVVAGSSLVVQPAAGLLDYYEGNKMVIINDQPTPYDGRANLVIRDRIGAVIEQLL